MNDTTANGIARRTLILTLVGIVVAIAGVVGTWYGVLRPPNDSSGTASVGTGIATVGKQRIDGDVNITGAAGAVRQVPASAAETASADVGIANVGEQEIDGSVTIDASSSAPEPTQ
jgi:hypothetical protein